MIDAKSAFERLEATFPEVGAFKAPFDHVYALNVPAGKQIDLANTILECTSKLAWSLLPDAPSESKIEKAAAPRALQCSQKYFEQHDRDFYPDVWEALVAPAGRILGHRSERGDISHGHLPTKEDIGPAMASLSLNLALSFAAYFFAVFDGSSEKMRFDDHSENEGFNEWLNERGESFGEASYSWLVYSHDYPAYEGFYDQYEEEKSYG
jgi:hypothetical protein